MTQKRLEKVKDYHDLAAAIAEIQEERVHMRQEKGYETKIEEEQKAKKKRQREEKAIQCNKEKYATFIKWVSNYFKLMNTVGN